MKGLEEIKPRTVYIVGGLRSPFVKSFTAFKDVWLSDLMHESLEALIQKYGLKNQVIGDVALGAVLKRPSDWNLARECVLGSSLDPHTPGYDIQRACGTSLEATLQIARKIAANQIEVGIAGGVDTNSDLPLMLTRTCAKKLLRLHSEKSIFAKTKAFFSFRPSDLKVEIPNIVEPRTGLSMGEHCEKMVKEWNISRRAQDELALRSHQTGVQAYAQGFYNDLVINLQGIKRDGILREDTSLDKLAHLKPAFDFSGKGTLTAGNSSPLSDGSAAVLLASEKALQEKGWVPLAQFIDAEAAAVDYVHGEGLLMAPTIAVSKLLARNNLSLQDFDFYEIHEAFAGQVLCTLKAWETEEYCKRVLKRDHPLGKIDREKLNIKGGSVALGHPFAATGARIVASLAKMLHERRNGRGLISICTAGGMGVAAILEAV